MKKVLIASVCAFALCLTSCASKQAPLEEAQPEAPQTEVDVTETNEEAEETQPENTEAEETSEAEEEASENTQDAEAEAFPEPEVFEEPEIITLEPVEEPEPAEEENSPEEVEEEEPPVISEPEVSLPQSDETEEAQSSEENAGSENPEEASETEEDDTSYSDSDVITIEGGIDITDEDPAAEEEYSEKEVVIIPSRSVTLKKFEYLDVTYPGTGWIYMGLTDNSKDLAYFGRKLGTKDTQFSLQARAAGTKIVHFYRNDPLTGQYLDDYLEVVILAESGSNKTHIQAPDYKLPVQKKEKPAVKEETAAEEETESSSSKPAANTTSANTTSTSPATSATSAASTSSPASPASQTSTSAAAKTEATESNTNTTTTSTTDTADTSIAVSTIPDSASLLQEAQVLYNEKEYAAALNKLNQFFEFSTENRDQALYLQGQILEAKSEIRDIKGAIDAYTSLTKNYPASKLWDDANKRIIYLKRFYLEVR